MWNKIVDDEITTDRMSTTHSAVDSEPISPRRVDGETDVSYDATSYASIRGKLDTKMPKCFLTDSDEVENRFLKPKAESKKYDVTKGGKRVIRKRLSMSEFNASRLKYANSVNRTSNDSLDRSQSKDPANSSSSDSDTLSKSAKRSTDGLTEKLQHLLTEMKQLRSLDRDILRRFLIVNASIETQRRAVEEKQDAIRRSLSEEGEDPVAVNFDLVPDTLEDQDDDEESIQSVLSRHNSLSDVFNETILADKTLVVEDAEKDSRKDSGVVSSSSDSALSISENSSTLSSSTSLPVSDRSLSPHNPHSVTSPATSSRADQGEKRKHHVTKQHVTNAGTGPTRVNAQYFDSDTEDYYRLHGVATKRVSHLYQLQEIGRVKQPHFDDSALDASYSKWSGVRDSAESVKQVMEVRRMTVNRTQDGQLNSRVKTNSLPRPRSGSTSSDSQRASCTLDGAKKNGKSGFAIKRSCSLNGAQPAIYKLLQQHRPSHQRNLGKVSSRANFVPIAEQEPDVIIKNEHLSRKNSSSKFDFLTKRRDNFGGGRHHHTVAHNSSGGSLTSSSSIASSCSNSSLCSAVKYATNEADRHCPRQKQKAVWVPRRRHTVQADEFITAPKSKVQQSRGVQGQPGSLPQKPRSKVSKRPSLPRSNPVYRWFQTRDDVTFL